jgi:hypothetical protein
MSEKKENKKRTDEELYQTLADTERLLSGVRPAEGETYSLDSILAEFGERTIAAPEEIPPIPAEKPMPRPAVTAAPPEKETAPEEETVKIRKPRRRPDFMPEEPDSPGRTVPLEQVMSHTVEAVLEEEDDAVLQPRRPLRALLRRRREETEEIYESGKKKRPPRPVPEPEPEPEEPDMDTADRRAREECRRRHKLLLGAGIVTAVLIGLTVADYFALLPALWRENRLISALVPAALLLGVAALCHDVWRGAVRDVRENHCAGVELCAALGCVLTLGDCAFAAVSVAGRCAMPPFAAPAAAVLFFAALGQFLNCSARREAFHLLAVGGESVYAATVTASGAGKQRGTLHGFYNDFCAGDRQTPRARWQKVLVPVLLTASVVLSAVTSLSQHTPGNLLWSMSLLLICSAGIALPLTDTLPVARLIHRLSRSGCSVAGYYGARQAGRSRRMVLTDSDLFPPGTLGLNGLKIYGEEIGRVVSYAATMSRASHSQLQPLFEQLLTSEGGTFLPLDGLNYYEEGGVSGVIRGETVLLGTAYFMKKMRVALPAALKLKTGVFLAVDGHLTAVFAVKYQPSRNVEWALRTMRRNRFHPVLAVRDGNITPGLLKRKFGIETHPIYPDISTRLALSEEQEGQSERGSAVIYREGLMPFAETIVGSRRCCSAVRIATILAFAGSLCGLLLGYYFISAAHFDLLSPLMLTAFLLLWQLPCLLLSGWVRHY